MSATAGAAAERAGVAAPRRLVVAAQQRRAVGVAAGHKPLTRAITRRQANVSLCFLRSRERRGTPRLQRPTYNGTAALGSAGLRSATFRRCRRDRLQILFTGRNGRATRGLSTIVAAYGCSGREDAVIELLERQKKLTANQWKLICTANIADLLDFFDFFLIGYVIAALTKEWSLPYWQGGAILLASGLGAVPGAFIWGWLGDRIGRRTVFIWSAITISLATGIMVFTPGQSAVIPGWLFLVFFRIFVGIGNAGIFTIDLPLVQEFIPAYKRGWVSALVTTLLPGGSMLAGLAAWQLLPIIGWRYLFLVGLSPLVLVFMIRYWVPESPRWLTLMGRHEEARRSLAWALMIDPKEIVLLSAGPEIKKPRWVELFQYPRLVATGCLTGLTQTGGASLGLWGPTLLVLVLVPKIAPEHAAFLMIFVNVAAILGRFSITALIEPLGRRGSGTLYCVLAAILMALAGYLHDVYIAGASLFYILIVAQTFFGSAVYTVVGPYMAEIWPARLRASGMGLSYGVGNCGKFIGPLGLALIMGAGDLIKPAAPNLAMLGPAFVYFAAWYVLGLIGFWVFGFETKGRTFDEIDSVHDAREASPSRLPAQAT